LNPDALGETADGLDQGPVADRFWTVLAILGAVLRPLAAIGRPMPIAAVAIASWVAVATVLSCVRSS
jgi:hypothetical protein